MWTSSPKPRLRGSVESAPSSGSPTEGERLRYAIAAKLGAPAVAVSVRHNPDDTIYSQATGQVRCDFASFIPLMGSPGPFLVVDDICGTGATLAAVVEILTWLTAPEAKICTATLCRNVGAPPGTPDLHVWSVA